MKKMLIVDTRLIAYLAYHRKESIFKTFHYITSYADFYGEYDKIIYAFDSPKGSKKRKELYSEYKAHRRAREQEQTSLEKERKKQFNKDYIHLYELFKFLGNPILIDGLEADDIANIIVDKFKDKYQIYLLSSDSDWAMNLLNDNIKQIHLVKGLITKGTCFQHYGKEVEDITFIQSLCGIAKENVKGVYKFGEGRCKSLLYKEGHNQTEVINIVQGWVDAGKYGCKLPDNYSSVIDLYNFNYELLRPFTLGDLTKEELDSFKSQFNISSCGNGDVIEELDNKAIELFGKPLMLDMEDINFYFNIM